MENFNDLKALIASLEEDAIKFLAYNVWGTYVGEYTPIYVDLMGVSNFERIMNIPHNNFDFQK